jgi:hypothetical protein
MHGRALLLLRAGLATAVAVALVGAVWLMASGTRTPEATRTKPAQAARAAATVSPKSIAKNRAAAIDQAARNRSQSLFDLRKKAAARSKELSQYASFTYATFNGLGASHTGGHGDRARMAAGSVRGRWAGQILSSYHVDVASLQEWQSSQSAAFRASYGGTYETYPSSSRGYIGQNTVAWRRDRFELVRAETRSYPYFHGKMVPYPLVLLKDKASGVEFWVASYHNPFFKQNVGWKHKAVQMQASDARALLAQDDHAPLIVGGDMNDRAAYFCAYAGSAPMHAANGGSTSGGCRVPALPRPYGFDWIMGSPGVAFSGYGYNHGGLVASTSDHPIVYTHVKVWRGDRAPLD